MLKNITQIKTTALAIVGAFAVLAVPLGIIDAGEAGELKENLTEIVLAVISLILLFSKDPK